MREGFYIIDCHCHLFPDKIAWKASKATGDFYHEIPTNEGSLSDLLLHSGMAGIDRIIVQSVATTPRQVSSINRFIADTVEKEKGKLIGFGSLHPESDDIERDVDELISLGLRGVKLHPDIQNFKSDDYRCLKIYELCEKRHLPVLMHCGDKRYDNSNPNRIVPILDTYDNLIMIGAHFGGWSIWEEAYRELKGRKNFYVDCSSSLQYISAESAVRLIYEYGPDKVLFGTDFPLHAPEREVEMFFSLGLDESTKKAILSENAKKLFGIDLRK